MNPYYTVTGAPTTQSRGYSATIRSEYGLIATGFDAVYTAMLLRGLKAGETWTGTHVFTGATVTFATQSALDNSTKAATTAYADSAVSASAVTLNAAIALKADIASPTFTGTPAAPTASLGTSTTQIATTAFVAGTAFSAALPSQTGNSGKFVTTDGTNASWSAVLPSQTSNSGKFLTTNGTNASWSAVLPSQTSNSGKFLTTNGTNASWSYSNVGTVTTATTATTLTSTPTLLKITPASYGVAVTLPDATTCSLGGPLHIIDNKGAYPVRVLNSSGTLLGFIFAGVVSHISLIDNSSAAGVWTVENSELVGPSAQLLTNSFTSIQSVVDIGSNKEVLVGGTGANGYAVVYDRSTNTFGSVTLVRAAGFNNGGAVAYLSGANQVLVVSCVPASAAFEAVTLSISGTTITVNTAATATLSANINTFADGCGLIAVGSSFVTSYTVATPAAQLRALSISGTTVTIGSATVLAGGTASSTNGLIAASGSVVLAASYRTGTTAVTVEPFTVSGTTLTLGTAATTGTTTGNSIQKFFPLGSRWCLLHRPSSADTYGAIVSLSGTTVTISTAAFGAGITSMADAIVVGSDKVLVLGADGSDNANILTDTAGTASFGTRITLSSQTTRACLYVSGTDVAVYDGTTTPYLHKVDCSGASPVKKSTERTAGSSAGNPGFATSNAVLTRGTTAVYGTSFAQNVLANGATDTVMYVTRAKGFIPSVMVPPVNFYTAQYRGRSDSERWLTDAATVITKLECVA